MGKIRINANVFMDALCVSWSDGEGNPNFMAVGWVSRLMPITHVGFGIYRGHHTPEGIKENGTFSVNIPSADMVEKWTTAA